MPLLTINESLKKDSVLLCWELGESLSQLVELANKEWLEVLYTFKSERRQKEYLASRLLLSHYLGHQQFQIDYDQYGGPFISQLPLHLSISHTVDTLTILLHPTMPVGIDIELISPKIHRVVTRFMSDKEQQLGVNLSEAMQATFLTACWSAKEAMYKWYRRKQLSFKNHLQLKSFHLNDSCNFKGHFEACIQKEDYQVATQLPFFKLNQQILVYMVTE